eukprot:XP_014776330.1 PREDICTED: uncharacterized protein LOC106873464 [Octopus bimaculoides]
MAFNRRHSLKESSDQKPAFLTRLHRRLSLPRKYASKKKRKTSEASHNSLDQPFLDSHFEKSHQLSENEKVYCKLLNSLIHPLGASDTIFGLRPGDLTDYLRTPYWYLVQVWKKQTKFRAEF